LVRPNPHGCGDIGPTSDTDVLTVRLGSLSPGRATTAVAELCHYRTATETRYVGTDLVLRYEVDTRPPTTPVL
jgi:hypothetical protein